MRRLKWATPQEIADSDFPFVEVILVSCRNNKTFFLSCSKQNQSKSWLVFPASPFSRNFFILFFFLDVN